MELFSLKEEKKKYWFSILRMELSNVFRGKEKTRIRVFACVYTYIGAYKSV